MNTTEQIVTYVLAVALLAIAVLLLRKEKYKLCTAAFVLGFVACLSAQSWFQGLIKTEIISRTFSTLEAYGKKLDDFQATTAKMRAELADHQTKLDQHQKEIDQQQGKLRLTQTNLAEQAQMVSNNAQQVSFMQAELSCTQTNINEQQKKIEDVEFLVSNLFSKTTYQKILGSDTNVVKVLQFTNGVSEVFIRLDEIPIPKSVTGSFQSPTMQAPLYVRVAHQNVLVCYFSGTESLPNVTFNLQYVPDTRKTNKVTNITFDGYKVFLDGQFLVLPRDIMQK